MKKRLIALTMLLSMLMVLSSVSSVFAAKAGGDGYKYTITVYSGNHGHFEDGSTVKKITAKAGERVNIDYKVVLNDDEEDAQYYVRGFRETGHDNDEKMAAPSFDADEDTSYEVAYGMKGGMVKYTVMYVDKDGEELEDSNEYYGMVGDKPVVSYHYINGYQPNAYNLTKTLKADEDENIFAFSYSEIPEGSSSATESGNDQAGATDANSQNNANANANNANGDNANAGANGADGNTPANVVDLDDNATPQASPDASNSSDSNSHKSRVSPGAVAGGAAGLAAIAGIAAYLIKRRRESEDYE